MFYEQRAQGTLKYNITLAGHYEHNPEESYSHRTAVGRSRAGIVGGNSARRMRSAGACRHAAAAARLCCTATAAAGLRRTGRGCRSACDRSAAAVAGLRPTALPRRRLFVDSGLLVLGRRRVLLGSRDLGAAAASRRALDSRLLGVRRWRVCLPRRLLGPARRVLRRRELWIRIRGCGVRRRTLGG